MKVPHEQLELMKKDRIILGSHCGNGVYRQLSERTTGSRWGLIWRFVWLLYLHKMHALKFEKILSDNEIFFTPFQVFNSIQGQAG